MKPFPSLRLSLRLAALAAALLLSAPALSHAQQHGTTITNAVSGAQSEVEARTGGLATEAHQAADHDTSYTGDVLSAPAKGLVTGITTAVVFLVLLAVLGKVAFGPIAVALKKREDKIREDIEGARAANAKAQALLKEYETKLAAAEQENIKLRALAVAEGEKAATSLKSRAQQEAEELREKAQKEIEGYTDIAKAQLREEAVLLSTAIAEKILKRAINPADQQDLVRSSLEQLEGVGRS